MTFHISRFVFQISGCGSRVSGFGFRVSGFGFRVSGFGFRVAGLGFRVSGSGFQVSGYGFRVQGFRFWASPQEHYRLLLESGSWVYRGTSLISERTLRGPYLRPMTRVLGGSWGGGRFLMGEIHVPL